MLSSPNSHSTQTTTSDTISTSISQSVTLIDGLVFTMTSSRSEDTTVISDSAPVTISRRFTRDIRTRRWLELSSRDRVWLCLTPESGRIWTRIWILRSIESMRSWGLRWGLSLGWSSRGGSGRRSNANSRFLSVPLIQPAGFSFSGPSVTLTFDACQSQWYYSLQFHHIHLFIWFLFLGLV